MKKIIIILTTMLIAFFLILLFYKKYHATKVTIEWHQINKKSYSKLEPIFNQLENITVEAFLQIAKPYVYAKDSRIINLPPEQKKNLEVKINSMIAQGLKSEWKTQITDAYNSAINEKSNVYLAIAKKNKTALGFCIFKQLPLKQYLNLNLINITEEYNKQPINPDQIYASLLAVLPQMQNMGIGKKLIFEVLKHTSNIKEIYLTTASSEFNKNTQQFYEHIGFTKILKGLMKTPEGATDFEKEKIVYLYENK